MSDSAYSQQDPDDSASDWSLRQFQINQTLARVRTMVLVKVTAITGGAGAIAAPGTVQVQPLVKLVDGQGNATSHGLINNIPVFRVGGNGCAVICDPAVGDIGWMAVADRDSSSAKANQAEANPGSRRMFDLADGVYMGSLFGQTPTQYIGFNSDGMVWNDKNGNTLTSDSQGFHFNKPVFIDGQLNLSGTITGLSGSEYTQNISTTGDIIAADVMTGSGATLVTLRGHEHTGNNLPPNPPH